MVQRVPAHLGETTSESVSPWIMVAGVALLILVVCAVLFVLLGGGARFGIGVSATATPTRTRTTTPALTILPITLATPTPSVGPTAATVKYKVKSGDTLSGIAAKYKVSVQAIMTANGLKDDNIRIGDDLIIPLPTPTPAPTTNSPPTGATPTPISFQSPPTSASPAVTPGVIHYSVKRGDTLSSIASTFGSTIDGIRAANQLDSDFISIGQDLIVPVGSWTPTPTIAPTINATATPTSPYSYAAPDLLSPQDAKQFRGSQDVPQLMWTSPSTLKPNEYYVVHIDYTTNGKPQSIFKEVKQGTSLRLDLSIYPGANANGTPFSWYVVIVSQPTGAKNAIATSPASVTRTFVWY